MTARALTLAALAFALAAVVATLNGSTPDVRIAASLGVLPVVLLVSAASIVRAVEGLKKR